MTLNYFFYNILFKKFITSYPKHFIRVYNLKTFFQYYWDKEDFIPTTEIKYIKRKPFWYDVYLGTYQDIPIYMPLSKNI